MSIPDIEIKRVDPLDGNLVESWVAMGAAVVDHDIPGFPPPHPARTRLRLLRTAESVKVEDWLAVLDGVVVGHVELEMPTKDNLHLAELSLEVHPEYRRRGIGTRLLEFAEQRAADNERDTIISYAIESIEGLERFDESGKHFAAVRGYPTADFEICRRNDLAKVDDDELGRLYSEAWNRAAGYELVEWIKHSPEDLAAGVAKMEARMWTDPPMGDLDIRPAVYSVERLRDEEYATASRGTLSICAAVRHVESGEVAGYTAIYVLAGDEEQAWQGDTIVDPGHRGKRLGTILKAANQRQLRRYRPMIRYVNTWNAESNDHMIAINEAVGYRRFFRELAVQKKLK
jgi:GNAT superfamily N-acetyltransferase